MSVCVRVSCLCVCVCVSCVCVRVCEWKKVRPTKKAIHESHPLDHGCDCFICCTKKAIHESHPLDHPSSVRSSLSFPSCPHFGRVLSRCEGNSGELQQTD